MMHISKEQLMSFLWPRWLPFVGQLRSCGRNDFKEALVEIFWTTVASTMPLWFLPLILPFILNGTEAAEEVRKTLKSGELFIYSSALLGPLIYTLNKEYGEPTNIGISGFKLQTIKFPHSAYFVGSSLAILLASSATFYLLRDPALRLEDRFNSWGITQLSTFVYAASTSIYFLACCYRNALDGFKQRSKQTKEEDNFSNLWMEKRDE